MSTGAKIRLLLADVDGTLVTDDKVLTEAAIAAVGDLRAAGIAFAITSSRPPRGLRMLFERLGLTSVVSGLNGGMYVNPDLSLIESYALEPASARLAVETIEGQGLDVWVYAGQDWLVRDPAAPHVAREEWILKFAPTVVPDFSDTLLTDAIKIVAISDDPERMAACERTVQGAIGEKASVLCSQTYFLDITDPRANKGAVVDTLSKRMNIPRELIATIGDMPTDALMFRRSGFSIAMGNASDAVKAQASAVTDSNQNEGFAKAVRKFILATPNGAP